MKELRFPYLCHECKKIVDDIEELLFVENRCLRGFCSEDCIEDFYTPVIKHFDSLVQNLRLKHNCQEETFDVVKSDAVLIEEVSNHPDEVYKILNDQDDELYVFVKYHFNIYSIVICTMYNDSPAFIFSYLKTINSSLLNEFRIGEKIDVIINDNSANDPSLEGQINYEFIEEVENKKSTLLSELLTYMRSDDIGIENFHLYDEYLTKTLNSPDEVFEKKDKEGDRITYFLKTVLDQKLGNFFYIVATLKKIDNSDGDDTEVFIPIMAIPTNDIELYEIFRSGERIHGLLKN